MGSNFQGDTQAACLLLTIDFENDDKIPPNLAHIDTEAIATLRTHVGKSSGV